MSVAVFIPSMYRPEGLERTIKSIKDTSNAIIYAKVPADAKVSRDILEDLGVHHWIDTHGQRYVQRIQFMFALTYQDWFVTGADDVVFHPGWLEAAEPFMEHYSVIGFEDWCNPELPGTNFIVSRKYIREQGGTFENLPGIVFHQGYNHNFCDNELVTVATSRQQFAKCTGVIEHFHPTIGKAAWDSTYNWAQSKFHEDAELFNKRASGEF